MPSSLSLPTAVVRNARRHCPARSFQSGAATASVQPSSMWHPQFRPQLARVESTVQSAITDLKEFRASERLWSHAFQSILAMSRSPWKHLVGPQLVLLGHSASSESVVTQAAPAETFAAGVELHHLFMLIHDDVADAGTVRRGVPTLSVAIADASPFPRMQRQQLDQLATVVGDAVHARSMSLMMDGAVAANAPNACETVLEGAYRAGAAQFDDLAGWAAAEARFKQGLPWEVQMRSLLLDKRAFHGWIAPLVAGLHLGTAAEPATRAAMEKVSRKWAEHVGIAYQAIDDLADLVLPPSETGKDSLQDLRDGRLAMPIYFLMQYASDKERGQLRELLLRPDCSMLLSERKQVIALMDKYRLREVCIRFARAELAAADSVLAEYMYNAPQTAGNAILSEGLRFYGNAVTELVDSLAGHGKFSARQQRLGLWQQSGAADEMCESMQHCVVP